MTEKKKKKIQVNTLSKKRPLAHARGNMHYHRLTQNGNESYHMLYASGNSTTSAIFMRVVSIWSAMSAAMRSEVAVVLPAARFSRNFCFTSLDMRERRERK